MPDTREITEARPTEPSSTRHSVIVCVFNIVLFPIGALIMGVGILLLVNPAVTKYIDPEFFHYYDVPVAIIICGVIFMMLTCVGCCGIGKDSRCLHGAQFFILLVILLGTFVKNRVSAC